jgi:hypothetical protein
MALIGSLILGVFFGWISYRIFKSNVPTQWLSDFQAHVTPAAFVGAGLLFGVAICIWALLVAWAAPRFRSRAER